MPHFKIDHSLAVWGWRLAPPAVGVAGGPFCNLLPAVHRFLWHKEGEGARGNWDESYFTTWSK